MRAHALYKWAKVQPDRFNFRSFRGKKPCFPSLANGVTRNTKNGVGNTNSSTQRNQKLINVYVQSNTKNQITVHIREIGFHKQEVVRWCLNVCVTVVTRNSADNHQKKTITYTAVLLSAQLCIQLGKC